MSNDSQQAITHVLQQDSKVLSSLLAKLNHLRQLQAVLVEQLEPRLAAHCQVASLENNALVVITDSALWAMRFRFLIDQLIPLLRVNPLFNQLKTINCKIRPKTLHPMLQTVAKPPVARLSAATSATLLEGCKNITHNKLKTIMEKIAQNTYSKE